MKRIILTLLSSTAIIAMDQSSSINSYKGEPITPELLVSKKIRQEFPIPDDVADCMHEQHGFFQNLVTTPHPLTWQNWSEKSQGNLASIKALVEQDKAKTLNGHNYVLQFTENPKHVFRVNRWGSRGAHWLYEIGINVLEESIDRKKINLAELEYQDQASSKYRVSYQGCSPFAHYLRCKEVGENFAHLTVPPTYLVPIPKGQEEDIRVICDPLSDERYVVAQEWIEGFKELKEMPDKEQGEVIRNMPPSALKEIYDVTVYAALWNMRNNIGIRDNDPNKLCMLGIEQHIFHKAAFFYFQGNEGERQYVEDVTISLERIAQLLLKYDENQFERWVKMTKDDHPLQTLLDKYKNNLDEYKKTKISINYDREHLKTAQLYK